MNLRFSTGEIRFRISIDEVKKLLETLSLSETISFAPSQSLTMSICLSETFSMNTANSVFELNIPRDAVQKAVNGKNKSEMNWTGIWSTEASEFIVIFEIDAFSKKTAGA